MVKTIAELLDQMASIDKRLTQIEQQKTKKERLGYAS